MKILTTVMLAASIAMACIAPIKPLPPIGCYSSNAVLITTSSGSCYWIFVNCGR